MIGVFGGTFDPVHYGHLKPARDVMRELGLRKVLFIPNHVPPHREQPQLPTAIRVELLQLALQEYPGFELDLREIGRNGMSYMLDTLISLKQDYPDESLCLIIGMDALLGLTRWYCWQRLFEYCHIVVTARPGYALPDELHPEIKGRVAASAQSLRDNEAGKILIKSVSLLDISASDIRQRMARGEDVREWMPASVYHKYSEIISLNAD